MDEVMLLGDERVGAERSDLVEAATHAYRLVHYIIVLGSRTPKGTYTAFCLVSHVRTSSFVRTMQPDEQTNILT